MKTPLRFSHQVIVSLTGKPEDLGKLCDGGQAVINCLQAAQSKGDSCPWVDSYRLVAEASLVGSFSFETATSNTSVATARLTQMAMLNCFDMNVTYVTIDTQTGKVDHRTVTSWQQAF